MYVSKMDSVLAALAMASGPRFLVFNDAPNKIEELQDRLLELNEQMNNLQARADADQRAMTDEESKEMEEIFAVFEEVEADIERRNRIIEANSRISTPGGRQTDPDDVANMADRSAPRPRRPFAAPRDPDDVGKWGFRNVGDFAMAVKNANASSGRNIDPRLIANAPTTVGTEGTGADGGFAVPPDFRRDIAVKVMGEESLLGRTDMLTSSSNSITIPKDETTPWASSGGIQAYWESEGNQLTQSKPSLEQSTVRLNKLTALVPVTEELLGDAPALSTYLRRKTPEKFDYKVTNAILNGTGAGQPLGILNSGALVTVNAESGQSADTVRAENISNMWSRMYAPCRANAVWLINQDIEPQLDFLKMPDSSNPSVPLYMPPGGLADSPYGRLKGRPVIATEACKTLGDAGDIILVDLKQYLSATKTGGIRQDVSMHLWFDYDTLAFRFIMRVAGQPWWSNAIDPANGSNTRSCFVTLAERA